MSNRTAEQEMRELVRLKVLPPSVLEEYEHPAKSLTEGAMEKHSKTTVLAPGEDTSQTHPTVAKIVRKKLNPLNPGLLARAGRKVKKLFGKKNEDVATKGSVVQEALKNYMIRVNGK